MNHKIAKRNNVAGRWLDPFLEDFFSIPSVFDRRDDGFTPRVNITESEEKLIFTFELPGLDKNDIKVSVANQVLTVTGRREGRMKSEKERLIREEIRVGGFERQFTLPELVRTDSVDAKFHNGILTIELEKKEEVKPREIEVKVS